MKLNFGAPERLEASLSSQARRMVGSEILKIASDVRARIAAGEKVCNLTVGDFDASQFPIPSIVLDGIKQALDDGHTNYPPSDGVLVLRQAIVDWVEKMWSVRYPVESSLVASGARPLLYAVYRCLIDPGEMVVYPVPSWNNNHYVAMTAANGVAIPTKVENGFMPTVDEIRPFLSEARLIALNTPSNPTGTVIDPDRLKKLVEMIVEENEKRSREGRRNLYLMFDQVYASLVFGKAEHRIPTELVPEAAPWTILVDGVSKAFASTRLRVGWALAPPELTKRMKDMIGHVGAWAPRPEQIAYAGFLKQPDTVAAYQKAMNERVRVRLSALYNGFKEMKADGYPVECIAPQGAIYLSLQIDALNRSYKGTPLPTNESWRQLLLERAGLALVAFQAFGLEPDTGWFRMSVGAVSIDDIEQMFPRIRALFDGLD